VLHSLEVKAIDKEASYLGCRRIISAAKRGGTQGQLNKHQWKSKNSRCLIIEMFLSLEAYYPRDRLSDMCIQRGIISRWPWQSYTAVHKDSMWNICWGRLGNVKLLNTWNQAIAIDLPHSWMGELGDHFTIFIMRMMGPWRSNLTTKLPSLAVCWYHDEVPVWINSSRWVLWVCIVLAFELSCI